MKIQLNQTEIENALKNYVAQLGFDLSGREIEFDFTAGRGVSRITADLDISDDVVPVPDTVQEPEVQETKAPTVEDPSAGKEVTKPFVAKRTVRSEPEVEEPKTEKDSELTALSTTEDPASVSLFSQ